MRKFILLAVVMFSANFALAQNSNVLNKAKSYLKQQQQVLGFSSTDFEDLSVQTNYTDEKVQVEYAYIQQNIGGYPIYGAIANFALKNGEIVHMAQTFHKQIHQKIGNQALNTDLNQVASLAANHLGLSLNESAFLNTDFKNEIMYFPNENGDLDLSWVLHLNVQEENELKILELIVHAQTGEILSSHNHLLSCSFDIGAFENPMTAYKKSESIQWLNSQYANNSTNDGATYNVFQLPVEAPNFGGRTLINSSAHSIASPFGWHDTDGQAGPEYTDTRGNNVTAFNDKESDGLMWLYYGGNYQFNGFAEGGPDLNFDFPLDFNNSLYQSSDASTTNLFYMNNMMHDVWYQYGFTEAAGNFQVNNYDRGGVGNDQVWAFGQTGENMGSMNNAMFGTPSEGGNPYMIMFMWNTGDTDNHLLSINTPGDLEGNYEGVLAGFGPGLPVPPLTADLQVAIRNGNGDIYDACDDLSNAADLNGKIVVIRRGDCSFVDKVMRAQNAGAVAVIVVNNVGGAPIAMGGSNSSINIPAIMISMSDGNPIIDELVDGGTLNGSIPKDGYNDGYKDGSFDNGIIAHEYGHGISIRLTGGPETSSCLNNSEQMGEGWSDYFALMMTMYPGDEGTTGRGIGTYAVNQPTTGIGIRPTRYSTDMSINPSTYNRIKSVSIPHGVGYVWATMLWEMTWELIDVYGFDPDLYEGTGGNNIAMRLVMEGLKLQPCNPGFVDGRDAILQADQILYDGANQCSIWKAFAKRGLGYNADQGSSNSVYDGTEDFSMPPSDVLDCDNMGTTNLVDSQMNIYPNPAREEVYILTDKSYQNSEVFIQDLTGRTVLKTQIDLSDKRATLNVNQLQNGIYVLVINTEDGKITKKLIKR